MPRADASRKRCAIYTRKSSKEGLEQEFNSLEAQCEACEAYICSQCHEGWVLARTRYDDGGFSGGNMERPALQRLLADIRGGSIDIVVVYKVDRLTRSLADFARLVEIFDAQGVSFVSVTQQFNTTSSMGRLTLNVLLSFAQFEREVPGERIRDKIAASKKKGMWMGGVVPLGYDASERTLVINPAEAETVSRIFALYRELGCVRRVKGEADRIGLRTKRSITANGIARGGKMFSRGHIYRLLSNPIYIGQIAHKGQRYPGQHPALIDIADPLLAREVLLSASEPIELKAAVAFKRRGVETKLVLPGLAQQNHNSKCDPALIKAMARGSVWFEELATGRARSLQELARREGITRRYIRRLVNLAFLSPQLVEAILQGRQPVELTATRLTELDLPLDWTEQRRLLAS
jgi:DNA invertase Pin-like site-specific DNA recombinase